MRYIVIEYKGSHSISHSDRDLMAYESSNDLEYLRVKYSLPVIISEFNWKIEDQGFSLYHKEGNLGILLIDKEVISENSPYSPYTLNIFPLMISVMRDSKIKEIL